jgi:hypothetical protein
MRPSNAFHDESKPTIYSKRTKLQLTMLRGNLGRDILFGAFGLVGDKRRDSVASPGEGTTTTKDGSTSVELSHKQHRKHLHLSFLFRATFSRAFGNTTLVDSFQFRVNSL